MGTRTQTANECGCCGEVYSHCWRYL